MNARSFSVLIALALFATATSAEAAVIKVSPGESIQAAIDMAFPGDTILVEPGIYVEPGREVGEGTDKIWVGLHITTDNLRLIGKVRPGQGEAGKVILRPPAPNENPKQETGIYAAPAGCGPEVLGQCLDEDGNQVPDLHGFYIRGFTVEDFPKNGIQTRFVNGFKMIRNESVRNANNGIYPTISSNGLVAFNRSYGSGDTAMWVAACENVRVVGNDVSLSPIGLEVNVSLNVQVRHNVVHDNTVGIGLFHPNSAGNNQLPVMGNWVVEHNYVYNNNVIPGSDDLPNPAPPGSFQGALPPGVGILVLGVSDNVVAKNDVEDNDLVGIGVLGWCTATAVTDFNCIARPPEADPSANNNLVSQNKLSGNGLDPFPLLPPELLALAADLTYFSAWPPPEPPGLPFPESSSGNCFEKNKPKNGFTFVSSEPDGQLPTDGC